MPRTITTSVTVFTFDELSSTAQEKALATIAAKLTGEWWDSHDLEDIGATMLYSLATSFTSSGWDTYGVGDFPGIDNLKIYEWDLDRGQRMVLKGTITAQNAPALPWVDAIESVSFQPYRDYHDVVIAEVEPDCACDHGGWLQNHEAGCPTTSYTGASVEQRQALEAAIADAIHTAWTAGRDEMEYKGSADNARQWIEGNGAEFHDDGSLYFP
jgi:hypothetical protein